MENQTKPSSFILSFSTILQNKQYVNVIRYEQSKGKIYIFDKERLQSEILPIYFRHNKMSSFVRQLNLYGFEKVKNVTGLCYTHPLLIKGERLLDIISKKHRRNVSVKVQEETPENRFIETRREPQNYISPSNQNSKVTQEIKVKCEHQPVTPIQHFPGSFYPPVMVPSLGHPYCINMMPCPPPPYIVPFGRPYPMMMVPPSNFGIIKYSNRK